MRWIDRLEDALGGAALFACFSLVCFQVAGRLAGASISWTDELSRYLIIVATYFGASAALRNREHIRLELVLKAVPVDLRRWIEVMVDLLCAGYTATVAIVGYGWVRDTQMLGLVSAESALVIPIYVFQAVIPLGFGLMTLRLLGQAWRDSKGPPPRARADGPVAMH